MHASGHSGRARRALSRWGREYTSGLGQNKINWQIAAVLAPGGLYSSCTATEYAPLHGAQVVRFKGVGVMKQDNSGSVSPHPVLTGYYATPNRAAKS